MHKILIKLFLIIVTLHVSLLAKNIDINTIVKNSIGSHKYVFIFLHRTDCGYCESMQTFTLDDDSIKALIQKGFIFLPINISENDVVTYKKFTGSGRDFAKYVGYNFYPSSLFLNSENKIIYGVLGYQDKDQFLGVLKYIDSGAYKKMDYQTFDKKIDVTRKP
ncbi:MAG: thioredoxin fold domain-containing protein [Sulfuricurvum sp.]|nr:thioredoxin fold domain-containing protein [Sulfuricurvum sp.]MDD5386031.1 thioredoxin fold domain-containing protein [Sulfuricurvum sp.]